MDLLGSSDEEAFEPDQGRAETVEERLKRAERVLVANNSRRIKRYLEGELRIMVQFRIKGNPVEFMACYEGHPALRRLDNNTRDFDFFSVLPEHLPKRVGDVYAHVSVRCADQVPMLVDTVQLMKLPERVTLPSLVRFGCVECVKHVAPKGAYRSDKSGSVSCDGRGDWKVNSVVWNISRSEPGYEGKSKMVQASPGVLYNVGRNECQITRKRISPRDIIDAVAGIRIYFVGDLIGAALEKSLNGEVELTEMVFGPDGFRPDHLKIGRH